MREKKEPERGRRKDNKRLNLEREENKMMTAR